MARNTSREYQGMSPEDQRRFDGWMKANAVLGFILRNAGDGFGDDN